ncbi:MAG: fumarylacetoacetate hydrolase family protein [Rhizobiaceae bacterium]|nr:fumarylacetoacetate hydrolase family protein [Rhizobiaceae bacterium]
MLRSRVSVEGLERVDAFEPAIGYDRDAKAGVEARLTIFQHDRDRGGIFIGRIWSPDESGPSIITVRDDMVVDITSPTAPLVADICDMDDPAGYVRNADGREVGRIENIAANRPGDMSKPHFLAPCDMQAIKACGVTFASSMVERVIEEKAAGDPKKAQDIRTRVGSAIGGSLRNVRAGSEEAAKVKAALIAEGLWSPYLEVGIGPDAEVFSKAQVLSSVGPGAEVGLHPISKWNNPEPEIVLAVSSKGRIVGATLGNDVNLRDIEGRSALLLSKAKDNNASCAIGPMIRLFDDGFTLDDVRNAELDLTVTGEDGFELKGHSSMKEISRDPEDLVRQTLGRHHQYPDGIMLFLGTLFAPTQDRDVPGEGFTHKVGDVVTISAPGLGRLTNTVRLSTECAEWTFGTRELMRNLAERRLL